MRYRYLFAQILLLGTSSLLYPQPAEVSSRLDSLTKSKIACESKQKAINLLDGKWYNVRLQSQDKLPDVNVKIQYDQDSLRINAVVKDDHFRDSERGWRYGDGFFINFCFPGETDTVDTDNFYAYGFSLEKMKPVAVLVNKDGNYTLKKMSQNSLVITVDRENKQAVYSISLPWSALYPFNPLMDEKAGINIIYTSQNDDRSRKILKYIDDPYYDTELTNRRRFAQINFQPSEKSGMQLTCEIESRLQIKEKAGFTMAMFSPEGKSAEVFYTLTDSTGREIQSKGFPVLLEKGRNIIKTEIEIPSNEGKYYLNAGLNKNVFWKDSLYRFSSNKIPYFRNEILRLKNRKENSRILQSSISAVNYHLNDLEEKINKFSKRKDPFDIKKNVESLEQLLKSCMGKGSVYQRRGYLLSAFESGIDSTLQPFSIYLPEDFTPSKAYNLIITLHGSGEDELWAVKSMGKEFSGENNIILGPRGRDLSSWYTGQTETDIVQLINSVKEMFRINKTVLHGFSMGGYGAWRFSFMHPELFDGAIIISGIPFNLRNDIPENDIRKFSGKAKKLPILVIHGTEDHSLDIKYTDEFVSGLEKGNYDVNYVRIPGGGHGNFKSIDIIKAWLYQKHFL